MKVRTLCVWYPMWSLTRPDAPPDEPILVADDRVTGATPEVTEVGVRLGMARREAEAMAPFATVMVRDPAEEAQRFEMVVSRVEEIIPRVEMVSPGLLYVPIAGAVRFYGGEDALVSLMAAELVRLTGHLRGGDVLIGAADGPFAARWAAAGARPGSPLIVNDTVTFLAGLDLSTLREEMGGEEMIDTFRWLGIGTLGELARLPRDSLATRFGVPGVLAHHIASGEDRPVDPREVPPDIAVTMEFEDPLETLDEVAFISRRLVGRLSGVLRSAGVSLHKVTIGVRSATGATRERVWRSARPFTEKDLCDRVWWQLRAWVETSGIPEGIAALSIEPDDLSSEGQQLNLLADESTVLETERALVRAQALVGPGGVIQARPQGGRMPGERVAWSRWGEELSAPERDGSAPWPGATPAPSPAMVSPRPEPIEVEWDGGLPSRVRLGTRWEPVLTWSGPWRLSGRWWQGKSDADRYQLVTSAGAILCVVCEGRSYLAAIYD